MLDEKILQAAVSGAMAALQSNPNTNVRQRMTLSTSATPFGCCNFFDQCGDGDLLSLYYAGQLDLLDWMGFNVSDVCYRTVEFINYVRPAYSQDSPTSGVVSDPCADPNGIEYGSCKITVEDFGRIGRIGPVRDIFIPKKYCITSPLYRLDGTRVMSEREWDQKFVGDQIVADMLKLVVSGNAATPGQFGGLEYWVKTGYDCTALDSVVIDWNGNPMTGGNGITWNGNAVANTYDFIDVLLAAFRRIKQRVSWSPVLRVQTQQVGDMILVLPNSMIQCLLDHFTCWSVCPGSQYNEVALQTYEARTFRNSLLGGLFGDGQISLDGVTIPILGYDWDLIQGPKTGDIYFLTGAIGANRIWEGEYLNATAAAAEVAGLGYFTSDGNRVLWKIDTDNLCNQIKGWIRPRLFCKAPWAQIRFQDVQCEVPGGFLSPDPTETSFFPETSFSQAACP